MNEIEYILRIVLKARDELAAGLAKARTELRLFKTDANNLNSTLTNLNQALKNFDGHLGNITEKLQSWRKTIGDTDKDGKALIKTLDSVGKQAQTTARQVSTVGKTQEQLQQSARALRQEMLSLNKARQDEVVTTKFAATEYQRLGRELEKVALKMSDRSLRRSPAHDWAEQAHAALDAIKDIDKEIDEDLRKSAEARRKAVQAQVQQEKTRTAEVKSFWKELHSELVKDTERQAADIKRINQDAADEAVRIEAARQSQEEELRQRGLQAERRIAEERRRTAETERRQQQQQVRDVEAAIIHLATLQERLSTLRGRARGGLFGEDEIREAKRLEQEFRRLSNAAEVGSREFRDFGRRADELRSVIRSVGRDSERTGSQVRRGLVRDLFSAGDSVAALDNKMRGIVLLAVASFAEQLATAVAGLSGELVALAGSAAQAGGALGGILAAGAAQALPVIGLLAGAISRVNAVMDAFKQSQLLQKAQFTDAEKGQQKAIDKTNQLANAQDQAVASNERLADARRDLTKAQKDGQDQLEDLALAEKEAALAARGASLDVKEAQEALRKAVQSGASSLEIQQRQLAVDEARQRRTRTRVDLGRARRDRAAAGGDVANLEGVQNAERALHQAQRAAEQASRGLEQAQDKADRAASSTMTAAANLDFLLSQLSPAERRLYEAVQRIYNDYRRIFIGTSKRDGIYGVITSSFADAVDAVDKLMQEGRVIKAAQGLANGVAREFRKVTRFLTSGDEVNQFLQITEDAQQNLGPLVDMALKLVDAFTNIAVTANPAFEKLIEFVGPIVDKFLALTEDSDKMEDFFLTGEEHLESWLNLLLAIIDLFATLFGASADTGRRSIEDLTDKIKEWTDWIDDHHDQVQKFFQDSYDVVKQIGGVLEELVRQIAKTFSPEHLEKFAEFFKDVVLPALGGAVRTMGDFTDLVLTLVNTDLGKQVAMFGLMSLVFAQLATSTLGALTYFSKLAKPVKDVAEAFGFMKKNAPTDDTLGRFGRAEAPGGRQGGRGGIFSRIFGGARAAAPTAAATGGAATAETFLAGGGAAAAGGAAAGVGSTALIATGVGAIAVAVVALLAAFGKLDDIWNAVKDTAKDFIDTVSPAFDDLKDALEDLGITADGTSDVFQVMWDILGGLADFITSVLISVIKSLGDVLSGIAVAIIDTIAGLVKYLHGVADVWIGIFTLDWDQIKKGFSEIADGIITIIRGLLRGLKKVWEGVVELMIAPWKAVWDTLGGLIRRGIHGLGRLLSNLGGWIWDKIKDTIRTDIRAFTAVGRWIYNAVRSAVRAVGDLLGAIGSWVWNKIKETIRQDIASFKAIGNWIKDAFSDSVHAIGSGLEDIGKRIIDAVVRGIKKAPGAIKEAIKWLIDQVPGGTAVRKSLEFLGGKVFAQGGPVPGSGSGDTVRAWLTPGEHVWTKAEVEAAGGHDVMFALRRLLGGGGQGGPFGYQPGGAVIDPRTGQMHGVSAADVAQQTQQRQRDLATEREDYKKSNDQRAEDWRVMWNDMLITTRRYANDIEKQFRDMRVNTTRSLDRMYRDIRSSLADIERSFEVRGGRIVESWAGTWKSLSQVAYDGLNYIAHQTNLALKGLGEDTINFGLTRPRSNEGRPAQENLGGTGHLASGGWIGQPGQRGRDRGAYSLGAGEAVLNWAHQRYVEPALNKMYGFGLQGLFDRTSAYHAGGYGQPGFAAGGYSFAPIPGMPGEEANTRVIPIIVDLIKKFHAIVTDAYDRDRSAGHKSPGHNVTGTAVDMVPQTPNDAGWNMIEAMGKWAVEKGMVVGYGAGVPGSQAWPGHGRGNHIHIELGSNPGAVGDVLAATTEIGRPLVTGGGQLAKMVQAAIDMVLKAANDKLSDTFPAVSGATNFELGPGTPAAKVFGFFVNRGLSEAIAAGFVGTFQKESGFNTMILNAAGSGAQGLAQWLGGRLTALKSHPNWQSLQTQLNFVWEELHGPESGAFAAIKGAETPEQAAQIIDSQYERSDNILSAPQYARQAYERFHGKKFAAGGIVPGGDGVPVGIVAHAGEWVLNKLQQSRVANLLGLSRQGLGSMLGFYGGRHFQGGGDPGTRSPRRQEIAALMRNMNNLLSLDNFQSVTAVLLDIGQIFYGFKRLGRLTKSVSKFVDVIDVATKEGGLFDQLRAAIERSTTRARQRVRRAAFEVRGGVVSRAGGRTETQADIQTAQGELGVVRAEREDLLLERRQIREDLAAVQRRLKRKNLTKAQRDRLIAQQNNLQQRLDDANERVVQNTEDIFAAQEALAQAILADQQAQIDVINKAADARSKNIDIRKRIETAFGHSLDGFNQEMMNSLTTQREGLLAKLAEFTRAGADPELLQQISEQAEELRAQIAELAAQQFQDEIDAINQQAQRRLGRLDLFGRMADALGAITKAVGIPGLAGFGQLTRAQVFEQRGAALVEQRGGLAGKLAEAIMAGNTKAVEELTDQVAELDVSIAENTKAQREAAEQAQQDTFDFNMTVNDLDIQLLDATDAITGNTSSAEKLALLSNKDQILRARHVELEASLADAIARGDEEGTRKFTVALKQNELATKENTKAINDLTGAGSAPQSFTSTAWQWFRTPFFNGLGQLMPNYQLPSDMTTLTGTAGGPLDGMRNGNTFITNIEVNEAGGPIDATKLGTTIVFAQSTAQN